jgi:hypothetical protein
VAFSLRQLRTFIAISSLFVAAPANAEPTPAEIFAQRILPIFNSPNPSSCVECHLAGVDLKNYIRPSHRETFLSLRDQGLVDLAAPRASKILRLISMEPEKSDARNLIQATARQQEIEAFTSWLEASARDPKLRDAPKLAAAALAKPARPAEVIRHARTDRLLQSFEDTIWAQRFRCSGCHLPGSSQNAKLAAKHGEEVVNWMQSDGAEATMRYLIEFDLINPQQPERSLVLRKPLGEVEHGGGKKMVRGDLGYKAWRSWIDDYAKTVKDRYTSAADLPPRGNPPAAFPSEIWLKLTNTPSDWGDRLLQVSLYAGDTASGTWEKQPIAMSDRPVAGDRKLWQHNLLLLAAKGSPRAAQWEKAGAKLPPGRYLLRVHVDQSGRLADNWQAGMGEGDYAGEATVESAWPSGYGKMTSVEAIIIRK